MGCLIELLLLPFRVLWKLLKGLFNLAFWVFVTFAMFIVKVVSRVCLYRI